MTWRLNKTVLPQDTDHAGVMWHGSYLNWLEESRIDALSKIGLSYADLSLSGYEMPVVEIKIKYISPLHHGNHVLVESWALPQKGVKFPWKTIFFKDDGIPAAEAMVYLVLVRRLQSNIRLLRKSPDHLSNAFSKLIKGSID